MTSNRTPVRNPDELVPHLLATDGFDEILRALNQGEPASIDGAWGSSCALATAAIASRAPRTVLAVVPRIRDVEQFAQDVNAFCGDEAAIVFPAWETLPDEHTVADAVFGERLRVLARLREQPPQIIVASLPALLQPVPSTEQIEAATRTFQCGDEIDLDEVLQWFVDRGFERVTAVELTGEISVHGGIIDVFPPGDLDPLRIELFGDEIESIRRFSVETQRRVEQLEQVDVTAVAPTESAAAAPAGSLLDATPDDTWVVLTELQETVDEGKLYLDRLSDRRGLYSVGATLARCGEFPMVTIAAISAGSERSDCRLLTESVERFGGSPETVLEELSQITGRGEQVLIACHNDGEQERLSELLGENEQIPNDRVTLCLGRISRGFRMVSCGVVVIGDHELFGRSDVRRTAPRRRRADSRAIDSFLDLREGDLIVHLSHGIGRYRGMKLLEKDDQVEEHLELEFRDGVRVYVPVSLIHLVQKYVGAAKSAPQLSRLGSGVWAKRKQRVAEAVSDMASDMLRLQAQRDTKPGLASNHDSHWQHEFDAAFPYVETDDQVQAIIDVKQDMEQQRPMDRLICGDVGYGKTEVAMRAAFKCVDNGRQVAVLVPTTVLAEQHFRSFRERMAEFPVSIEVLSRFRSKREQREILNRMEEGTVDIVVGTHRLVQKDVRFKNLGMLIIDEEQRFGVEAKEMLKQMRLEIDILTLTATPIPRTLHMSLLGVRDISSLTTAPQDRSAIQTQVVRYDRELIRSAIVRELNRNGQIYFVHNRVYNIHTVADDLRAIVPEASISVAHGQMPEGELEDAMVSFVSGASDILVATTIIESGLDIPNANTIFIHQANIYGLADLHQLRGRVGRYRHRAYCYLVLDGKPITTPAAKRLKAIEEYSELGSGFKIAMRDLEIRGAGNILGTEQSGHISVVGYELYCQLLENAVRRLRNEPLREQPHVAVDFPVSAYLPDQFIPPGRPKIEVYRRLSALTSVPDLDSFADELRDRFGSLPEEVERLLQLRELQILAAAWKIDDLRIEERFCALRYRDANAIRLLARMSPADLRIVDDQSVCLPLESEPEDWGSLYEQLKDVLSLRPEIPDSPEPTPPASPPDSTPSPSTSPTMPDVDTSQGGPLRSRLDRLQTLK